MGNGARHRGFVLTSRVLLASSGFYIPWPQIGAIGGFAFIASLLMTIIPARQASSIPIAEALRYE